MTPTDEIMDPTWHDVFDRDDIIKSLKLEVEGMKKVIHHLNETLRNESGFGAPPNDAWSWQPGDGRRTTPRGNCSVRRDEYGGWACNVPGRGYILYASTARQLMTMVDESLSIAPSPGVTQ
jgi:hypothetical protein